MRSSFLSFLNEGKYSRTFSFMESQKYSQWILRYGKVVKACLVTKTLVYRDLDFNDVLFFTKFISKPVIVEDPIISGLTGSA